MSDRPAADRTIDLFAPETIRRVRGLCDACEKRPAAVDGAQGYRFCTTCAPPPSQRRRKTEPGT